jgi:hypothetical protein
MPWFGIDYKRIKYLVNVYRYVSLEERVEHCHKTGCLEISSR